jgi:hypothetical protein
VYKKNNTGCFKINMQELVCFVPFSQREKAGDEVNSGQLKTGF